MSTNRITLIRGTAKTVIVGLVDGNGVALTEERLEGAAAEFELRETPTSPSTLLNFLTTDPAHLKFIGSSLSLSFLDSDTPSIDLGTYSYQLTVTLADATTFAVVAWTPFYLTLGGTAATSPPVFDNTIRVDENYEGTNALAYMTPGGSPIENAQVRIYYKSDYDANRLEEPVGITETNSYGRWENPIFVVPGYSYVIQFFKPGVYGPDTATIVA